MRGASLIRGGRRGAAAAASSGSPGLQAMPWGRLFESREPRWPTNVRYLTSEVATGHAELALRCLQGTGGTLYRPRQALEMLPLSALAGGVQLQGDGPFPFRVVGSQ